MPRRGASPRKREPRFVIQKHDASTLHYDFRLEAGGVLKSWAIPKGPSTDPRDKRLAIRVEDHSLGYFDFEGVIGSGYGAGTVIVWDMGTYTNRTEEDGESVAVEKAIDDGHVVFELHGEKLRGAYALTRTGTAPGGKERWLLIKKRDEAADARRRPVTAQPESVLTGRTIEAVAEQEG
jgi:DNA ligase D-like protein (predicted 3'-phosphoesterase)